LPNSGVGDGGAWNPHKFACSYAYVAKGCGAILKNRVFASFGKLHFSRKHCYPQNKDERIFSACGKLLSEQGMQAKNCFGNASR